MTNPSINAGPIRSAFEQAGRIHARAAQQPGVEPGRGPASRQVAQAASPARTMPATSVEQAIARASQQTSVDFDFLIAQAQVESAMNPTARARTSSATGLYQFIESTWLGTMQRHGPRFGLDNIASQISMTQSGSAYVTDPATRAAILDLRNDPEIASLMAAGLAEDNRAHLAPILGRQPNHSELYLAHFLGAGGAGRFLSEMAQDPNQNAAELFRRPAAANRPVFYERNGAPRSLAGVMEYLGGKLERARASAGGSFADTYTAASLSPASATIVQRQPYLIADEAVFGPMNPPTLTGRNRPTIQASPTLSLAPTRGQRAMSDILQNALGSDTAQTSAQVRRAYDQLKAFGF